MKSFLISWSPIAEETYLNTLCWILEKWSLKEAEAFEAKVESMLDRIRTHKFLCPSSHKQKSLRRCVITPQTSMVYQIKDNIIELVIFFDNRSEHPYI